MHTQLQAESRRRAVTDHRVAGSHSHGVSTGRRSSMNVGAHTPGSLAAQRRLSMAASASASARRATHASHATAGHTGAGASTSASTVSTNTHTRRGSAFGPGAGNTPKNAALGVAAARRASAQASRASPSRASSRRASAGSNFGSASTGGGVHVHYPEGDHLSSGAREIIEGLVNTLSAVQADTARANQELNATREEFLACREAYDALVLRTREEGPALKERDRRRLQQALQELKDYEVYREVMEACLVKLQQSTDNLTAENHMLKKFSDKASHQIRKSKVLNARQKSSNSGMEKKMADMTVRAKTAEEKLQRVTDEKDAAVTALASLKGRSSDRDRAAMKETIRESGDIESMKKQIAMLQLNLKTGKLERDSVEEMYKKELIELHTAHAAALDMAKSYQEENDMLKQVVQQLMEPDTETNKSE